MRVTLKTAQGPDRDRLLDQATDADEPVLADDLTLRKRVQFTGDVHRGNYEEARRGSANIRITVEDVLVARNLPGSEPIAAGDQEYPLIGEPDDAYLTNYIRESRGFQQIPASTRSRRHAPLSRVHRITARP
jgi:hypothetical protein